MEKSLCSYSGGKRLAYIYSVSLKFSFSIQKLLVWCKLSQINLTSSLNFEAAVDQMFCFIINTVTLEYDS